MNKFTAKHGASKFAFEVCSIVACIMAIGSLAGLVLKRDFFAALAPYLASGAIVLRINPYDRDLQ